MSENTSSINSLIDGFDSHDSMQNTPKPESNWVSENSAQPPKKSFFLSKSFLISLAIAAILLVIFGVFYLFLRNNPSSGSNLDVKDPRAVENSKNKDAGSQKLNSAGFPDGPTDFVNPINGIYLTEKQYDEITSRKPVSIMLNNHTDSRPQAGISQADIIYEIVAEGGISRLMPIFHSQIPERVGSVRSARIYFMQIAAEYFPIFSHWGVAHRPDYEINLPEAEFESLLAQGAAETDPKADARSYIDEIGLPVANTDTAPNMFYREDIPNVAIEHTGYAKFSSVYDEFKKFYPEPSWSDFQEFKTWKFKDEKSASTNSVNKISYNFWDFPGFTTLWNYDSESNSYKRTQGGNVTVDRNNDQPVMAKNVVIQFAKETKLGDKKGHLLYDVIGSGQAIVYQDGVKIAATWSKDAARERTFFKDTNGNDIEFNRGLTWVVVLPDYAQVTEE